ncbi:protein kinase 1b, partial [Genlisea aurea]
MGICWSSNIKDQSPVHTGMYDATHGEVSSAAIVSRTEGEILQSPNLRSFSFSDLKAATRNFRLDSNLGGGGFGTVYKGWIDANSSAPAKPGSGLVVAVKKLNQESFQGHEEWLAEVNHLGQFSHPNLVKLIGYCSEDEHRFMVYEFVPRGSLEHHLFQRGSYFQPLSWILRLKVALGAAKGLAFLHNVEAKVIHRGFKTSSILLDKYYNAKLSDFGLVKSHAATTGVVTYGYAAPEYIATGQVTSKGDVYSFGVVLLEMLSGKRAVDKNRPAPEEKLVEWAKPYLRDKRKVVRVVDSRLEGQYTIEAVMKVADISLRCVSSDPRLRPRMIEVVREVEQLQGPNGID